MDFSVIGIWGNAVFAVLQILCARPIMRRLERKGAALPHHRRGVQFDIVSFVALFLPMIWLLIVGKLVMTGGVSLADPSVLAAVGFGSLYASSTFIRTLFEGGALLKPDLTKMHELRALDVDTRRLVRDYNLATNTALLMPIFCSLWGGILIVFAAFAK